MEREIFVCASSYDFCVGGVATYYLRIFEWLRKKNTECVLLLREDAEIDSGYQERLKSMNIHIMKYSLIFNKLSSIDGFCLDREDKIFVLTADLHCFLSVKMICEREKYEKLKILLYILHPYGTRVCENRVLNFPYEAFVRRHLHNDIIFMDQETNYACEKFYNINLKPYNYYRLGEIIPEINEEVLINRYKTRKDKFVILTVTRFDIPFKGYILGLIDTFAKLATMYPEMELEIIGYGKDQDVVLNKIEKLPLNIKEKIQYMGSVAYDKLQEYFKQAHVYIGMGTTLLDASIHGLPSIVATAFQEQDTCAGLFSEEYDNVGGNLQFIEGERKTFMKEIENVYGMNDVQYLQCERQAYNIVKTYYNINSIMEDIMKRYNTLYPSIEHVSTSLFIYDRLIIILKRTLHKLRKLLKKT